MLDWKVFSRFRVEGLQAWHLPAQGSDVRSRLLACRMQGLGCQKWSFRWGVGGVGGGGSLKYDASILGLWGGRVKAAELSLI